MTPRLYFIKTMNLSPFHDDLKMEDRIQHTHDCEETGTSH